MTLEERIVQLVEPTVESMGFELWGIEYLAAGRHSTLRIYIEKEGGITVDECGAVSRQVSAMMDVEDPISNAYMLEVSSPGLDRILFKVAQYQMYLNEKVQVRTAAPIMGRKSFKGPLIGVNEDQIDVEVDGEVYEIPFPMIVKAQVVPEF